MSARPVDRYCVALDEGLVSTRREGKSIYYCMDSPQPMAVMTVLYAEFCRA